MCTQYSNSQTNAETPIILLHGWGMNKTIWQPTIEQLPEQIAKRMIALDLPGYGDNNNYEGDYQLDDLADWLYKQVENHTSVIIVGWSLGGLVGQKFAIKYPEKVAQLSIVGSTPKFMAEQDWHGIKPEVLTMFAEQLLEDHKLTVERFLAIQAMGSKTAREDIKQLKKLVTSAPEPNLSALSKGLKILEVDDLREDWKQLACPTFALFGKLDSLVPFKAIQDIQNLNKNLEIQVLEKASHAPFISHPEQFKDWLKLILSK